MIWAQIIYFVITLILSIALSPKPQKPKSAAIDDFEFPTAEEGRPIPVVFGEIDITGPNVLWYGDLDVRPIKKRSGFSKATVGYKYFIGFHMGLCHGEADRVSRVAWGDKEVWTGNITTNGSGSINQPGVFGGEGRGGGVVGDFDIAFGGDGQAANPYLTTALGETPPAFRGIVSFVWKAGYIGNSEFVKPVSVRVKRILKGWEGTVWNSSKIVAGSGMNPIHIIYQALTDTRWGMGTPATRINEANFQEMADIMFDEGFGLNLIWNQAATIEQFIQEVFDHINGGLSFRPDTGLYEIALFRGGYDLDDLPDYGQDEVLQLKKFEKQGWGESVNEVTVTYTDPDTMKATTITAQDLANVDSQGTRITASLSRTGIRDHAIAREVLGRELAQRTMPLTKISFEINRKAWFVGFGSLFRFTWPERQCEGRVFRVLKIAQGTLQANAITIDALEDIFQYSLGTGLGHEPAVGVPVPPATPPDDDDSSSSVISASTTAPPSAANGDRYIVPPGATGAWTGHTGELAEWDDDENAWVFTDIPDGTIVYVEDDDETVQVIGGVPGPFGGGGGSMTVIDLDDTPDEEIDGVTRLEFEDATVTDFGTGGVRIKVSPLTTKGDIYTRSSTLKARRSVGTEGQYLRSRAADATGLAWENSPPVGEGASGCRAYKNATQSIADSTLTALTWPVEDYDTDSYHSTVTNTSRFVAPVDGKYSVGASVKWDSNATGVRELYVVVNGVTGTRKAGSYLPAANGLVQEVRDVVNLVAGDYVEFYVQQNSTAARDVTNLEQVTSAHIARVGVTAAPTLMRGATWVRTVGNIQTPVNDVHVRCPVKGVITGVTIGTTGGPGSCVVDIWKDTHANYPPTVADTICASAKPTISSASKYEDTTLTGWTTAIAAGDWLVFHLDSSGAFKAIFVQLYIKETQ